MLPPFWNAVLYPWVVQSTKTGFTSQVYLILQRKDNYESSHDFLFPRGNNYVFKFWDGAAEDLSLTPSPNLTSLTTATRSFLGAFYTWIVKARPICIIALPGWRIQPNPTSLWNMECLEISKLLTSAWLVLLVPTAAVAIAIQDMRISVVPTRSTPSTSGRSEEFGHHHITGCRSPRQFQIKPCRQNGRRLTHALNAMSTNEGQISALVPGEVRICRHWDTVWNDHSSQAWSWRQMSKDIKAATRRGCLCHMLHRSWSAVWWPLW